MSQKLLLEDQLSKICEINYEGDDVLKLQRLGAIAINQLMACFAKGDADEDIDLIALVLVRLRDL
jgi:hypothetical protein